MLKECDVDFAPGVEKWVHSKRFDTSQRQTIENNVLATFPALYSKVVDLFQAFETGNRLLEHAYTRSQNPRLPAGFDHSQPISYQDFHILTHQAVQQAKQHISQVVSPKLADLLNELQSLG